ncbi:MAG TPA: TonB-dependent receptor [Verrucomicrobiae bacterium]|jgi:iron complex outermembrane receptor protein|nr:TonB-dependent receptor [Verrucomicrobiae bacterium]
MGFCLAASGLFAEPSDVDAIPTAQLKRLSLEDLMQMDVTSVSKEAEPFALAPAAIQVVTADDMQRGGAQNIPEALRLADNLQVAQINSHDWAISSRGFNGTTANKLLVLMDGRTVYTPLYSGVFWDAQDYLLADLDRIEVISGPAGTLWGANAVNGVINITSKSAKDTQGLYLEAGGGNEWQDFTGARFGFAAASNLFVRVYGKYFDRESEILPTGERAGDAWRFGQTGFRSDWLPTAQNTVTLQGDYYDSSESILNAGYTHVSGGNLLTRFTHAFSEESDVTLQLYYDQTGRDIPGSFAETLGTYDVDFQHRLRVAQRHDVIWGLGYRLLNDRVANGPLINFLPAHLDQSIYSAFAQDEITLVKDVHLTLGSKVEHNHYSGWEVEPSGRLAWALTPKQSVWAAVSRAVRTPSRIDEDLVFPADGSLAVGDKSFLSETLMAYEAGYRAQWTRQFSGSASIYYNNYDHLRSITPGLPLRIANNLAGETYGMELTAAYQVLEWWRLRAGYDLLEEHIRSKPGTADYSGAIGETADPEHQFSIRSSMDLPHDIALDARLRFVDQIHNISGNVPGEVPSYFELDARLAWRATPNLELSLVGQNLLHNHHVEFGYPNAAQEAIVRSLLGKVTWRF